MHTLNLPGVPEMNAVAKAVSSAWSVYQERIFTFAQTIPGSAPSMQFFDGKRNAIVEAVAGSGKSTTLVQVVRLLPTGTTSIFLAFNKPIAEELKSRGVNGRTFHSLVFSIVMRHKGQQDVAKNKLRGLIDMNLTGYEQKLYGSFVQKLVSLGRNAGIGCLEADTPDAWLALADHHDIELDNDDAKIERALQLASQLLEACYLSPLVDFDDMMYIAVRDGLKLPKFDFVLVDEAQDTNAIQRAIVRKIMHPASRLMAVGDPAQAIYGFRGADSNSLQVLADEFDCIKLPLTVSYRCPTRVVEYARQYVSHIEAAPNAPEGAVEDLQDKWDAKTFQRGDLIVCRRTRPLVSLAYRLIKMRVPACIMGKEIGEGLAKLINRMNPKGIEGLETKIRAWAERESEKALAKKEEAKAEAIFDKRDAILTLIDGMEEKERTVPALLRTIETMFSDKGAAVTLASIHKSKGLEAPRVFWLNSSVQSSWARQPWQLQQETNLCYVAVTRAKEKLFLIEEKKAQ